MSSRSLAPPPATVAASPFERLQRGDHAAVAQALTVLERGGVEADALRRRLCGRSGSARVVGFAGPPGVGKSTLVSAYVERLRAQGRAVAVLAVDPSSPLSGGAILGDRTRMGVHTEDAGVFVRSVASRGHLGGLALAVPSMLDALDAAGFDDVVIEAVGAGQSEVEISRFADTTVVLGAPGLGDEVQALKAGLLEVADVLVVNKADLPHADRTARELSAMLELRPAGPVPPVVLVSATEVTGLAALTDAIDDAHGAQDASDGPRRRATELLRQATIAELTRRIAAGDSLVALGAALHGGERSLADAVDELIARAICSGGRNADD
ncbi:MAG: methylmalonyl Co-A mutase-associated GTPase MeaB [Actinomycetota bacterium]